MKYCQWIVTMNSTQIPGVYVCIVLIFPKRYICHFTVDMNDSLEMFCVMEWVAENENEMYFGVFSYHDSKLPLKLVYLEKKPTTTSVNFSNRNESIFYIETILMFHFCVNFFSKFRFLYFNVTSRRTCQTSWQRYYSHRFEWSAKLHFYRISNCLLC